MQKFKETFEGHVDHYCMCFPIGCGAHFLGFFQAFYPALIMYFIIKGEITADFGSAIFGFPLCAFMFYPGFYYIKMLCNNSKNNRKHFAKAFKCYGMTSVIVYGVYVLCFVIYVFAFGDYFTSPAAMTDSASSATMTDSASSATKNDLVANVIGMLIVSFFLFGMYSVQVFLFGHFVKVINQYVYRAD